MSKRFDIWWRARAQHGNTQAKKNGYLSIYLLAMRYLVKIYGGYYSKSAVETGINAG